jgi:hypothetical protein
MTDQLAAAMTRVAGACGLAGILGAACDAFEQMLPVIEIHQDPGSGAFTAFVMAGVYAANGRDALLFAPSLPPSSGPRTFGPPACTTALDTAIAVATLSRKLVERLREASDIADTTADLRACASGQYEADRLARLLAEVACM